MLPSSAVISNICTAHPGRAQVINELTHLLAYPGCVPPFLFVQDAFCPRRTRLLLEDILRVTKARTAVVRAQAATTQHAVFEAVLQQLMYDPEGMQLQKEWNKGWTNSVDGFCAGLREILGSTSENEVVVRPSSPTKKAAAKSRSKSRSPKKSPAKRKQAVDPEDDEEDAAAMDVDPVVEESSGPVVLVIDAAEHLRDHLPDLLVPVSRLAELARIDITTIFISTWSWMDIQPVFAASPDPYILHFPPLDKQAILSTFSMSFAKASNTARLDGPYSISLGGMFNKYTSILHDTCIAYVRDVDELAYICGATWVPFVQPIVDAWRIRQTELDVMDEDTPPPPPSEQTQHQFIKAIMPALTAALEVLYPRAVSPRDFATQYITPVLANVIINFANAEDEPAPISPIKHNSPRKAGQRESQAQRQAQADALLLARGLPRMAQYILVAAYVASFNPPRSDVRLFGRTSDGRGRRKKGGGMAKARRRCCQIPPRLAGPSAFPLERLIALLGRLLEDYDPPVQDDDTTVDVGALSLECAEVDVGRVQTLALINELSTLRLLHRTGAADKAIDGVVTFKCGISYAVTLVLAKELGIKGFSDYLWEPDSF
ncbi:origin recognition complex subunit 5 C-terminus-domain-containing protein [Auriculariales sp. MPI-PUGE-AT-0066]|nr:origin recognition complex subunit 5 C-terminus-domain-containing protein [Auriculariales sp. MPI-PUGE-AT-0066]